MEDFTDSREDIYTPENSPKFIHSGDDWEGQPFLLVKDEQIAISAGGELTKGIVIDPEFGILLQGPSHFSDSPENMSFAGGYWRINPMVTACIGSSSAIPVPWLVKDTPDLLSSASDIRSIVASLDAGI